MSTQVKALFHLDKKVYNKNPVWIKIKKMKLLYLFLLLPVLHVFIFSYMPMYGVQIAFKNFRAIDGIWGSKWNDFQHFIYMFQSQGFFRVLKNTVFISLLRTIFGFPAPIILALLLNELKNIKFKKTIQTISYLPTFMSWVVLSGIFIEVFSPERGIVNYILSLLGVSPIIFLSSKIYFLPILVSSAIWAGVGWNAVIYIASLSSIDPGLYESADLDGANRLQKALYISLPSLIPVITIIFLLGLSGILDAGFDQIFNMYNPLVYEVADVIDTYVFRSGLQEFRYDFATAVGLFKNVVGVLLVFGTNLFVRRSSSYGVW